MRQIKAAVRSGPNKGQAVLHKPEELVYSAILLGMKFKSDQDTIYWALKNTVSTTEFSHHETIDVRTNPKKPKKGWHAFAKGTVMLGKTIVKTDQFLDAKKYNFALEYRTASDDLGLPDIEVVSADFQLEDRSGLMNFQDMTLKNIPPLSEKVPTAEKLLAKAQGDVQAAPSPVKATKAPAPEKQA